ncbi:MAG: hypothetical protein KTR15_03955 [Phycisphaeraceae bacterium]|nr:hypothetical protein [Phycisphaeraceae bacterium]
MGPSDPVLNFLLLKTMLIAVVLLGIYGLAIINPALAFLAIGLIIFAVTIWVLKQLPEVCCQLRTPL